MNLGPANEKSILLPDKWDQVETGLLAIITVTREMYTKKPLFIQKPADDPNNYQKSWDDGLKRADREGCCNQEKEGACIHRVADDSIRTGRDNSLVFLEPQ